MWQDIFTAFALYLIIEGMIPFISPANFRKTVARIAELGDNNLRIAGLVAEPCDGLRTVGEQVDDLALALVTPLGADDDDVLAH